MRKSNEKALDSVIYARIREARISGADRQIALNAYRNAEQIVDLVAWIKAKVAAFGNSFLKPSFKH